MTQKQRLRLEPTPLQRVLGFDVAEEIYDLLPTTAQLIIDLKIEGYRDSDIARVLEMPRTNVCDIFLRSRSVLLKSKMRLILESRQYYREITPIVMEDGSE